MEISHTVHFSSNDNVEKQLDDLGFEYDREPFFDTYTIKIRVFESDARWSVYFHKTKEALEAISQLYIPPLQEPALVQAQDLGLIICASCSELKYQRFHKRGIMYLQRQAIPSELDMLETYEWCGPV